eukprot:998155-Rhodomonas_salina.4
MSGTDIGYGTTRTRGCASGLTMGSARVRLLCPYAYRHTRISTDSARTVIHDHACHHALIGTVLIRIVISVPILTVLVLAY